MSREAELEALLGELRGCHEPTAADRQRVREALSDGVVRQQLAGPTKAEERQLRGVHLRLLLGSGSSTMVGVMTLAAAAAAAMVTLARPALEAAPRLAIGSGDTLAKLEPEPFSAVPATAPNVRPRRLEKTNETLVGLELVGGCSAWPCLQPEPQRALTIGGVSLAEPNQPAARPNPSAARDMPEPAAVGEEEHEARVRLEVAPGLAFDVARGRVTPGAGVRVALPVTRKRDVALEATLQQFPVDGAAGLLLGSVGICWRPVRGELEASLCGRMGYESGTTQDVAREVPDPWRLTAGASAALVWNLTHEFGAYMAVQGGAPIAHSAGSERTLGMRVMAGPQVSF
jgi:hypothetical protein